METRPDWLESSLVAVRGRSAGVAVLGCGYVGLTLAVACARAGFRVRGVEADEARAKDLASGTNPVPDVDVPAAELLRLREEDRLTFSASLGDPAGVIVLCVPTPLRDGTPDLTYVERAAETASGAVRNGSLVVLESTTYPGTTEELVRPILERGSGLVAGRDFALAHSPERINPGDGSWGLVNTPKVVGGLTPASTELAAAFYGLLAERVVPVSSPRAAEMSKLLENIYRDVNIALVNEMAIVCQNLDIDPWEVIDAAATKPFGFTPFRPGPGVGGECIGVDPQYLAWRVRGKIGQQFRLLEAASDINDRMPAYVAQRAAEILNEEGKAVRGATVLVLGVAYKAGSGDVRRSPALRVAERLVRSGATVSYHDPFVPRAVIGGLLYDSVELDARSLAGADLVLILTDHPLDYEGVVRVAALVYDTRGVTRGLAGAAARVYTM